MIIDNANRCVFSRAVSPFHQSNLHIQLEVPDAVLALQEAVFIFLYGTFLQTRVLIKEVCKVPLESLVRVTMAFLDEAV